jgi:hypothetical protein
MRIRIKTNESALTSNGWKILALIDHGATYEKLVDGFLLLWADAYVSEGKVEYIESYFVDKLPYTNPNKQFFSLKDLATVLEEFKKLEVK